MKQQQQAAMEAIIDWLSDENELGAIPARIECAGEFELHGMRYYLFKYKKSPIGKWMLGVSGGYEGNSIENCGHVFSEMRVYDPETAVEQATGMVEMLRKYWISQAEEELSSRDSVSKEPDEKWVPAPGRLLTAEQRSQIRALDADNQFLAILELLDAGRKRGGYSPEDLDEDLEAALWKAYSCVNLGMYGMAERCLRRVETEGVKNALWCYRYSVALMYLCRYEESLCYARKGTAAHPEYPWGWLQLARICYQSGNTEEALEAVQRGLELVPGDYEFLTTEREIHEKRPFSEMLDHNIDPTDDQKKVERQAMDTDTEATNGQHWTEEPEPEDEGTERIGSFVGFVLLDSTEWNHAAFQKNLEADWGIICPDATEDPLVFDTGKTLIAISMIPAPVPDGEAERLASNNYLWPGAVNAAKAHVAHLLIAALNKGEPETETGRAFVKICASCMKQENVLGIETSGTVFQPNFYLDAASVMREEELPVLDWIYFGLCRTEKGMNGYTYGMGTFGKDEIEILDSSKTPQELRDFLLDLACYVLSEDVTLREGETIGFSPSQKLPVTRSAGVFVEGSSLKIGY